MNYTDLATLSLQELMERSHHPVELRYTGYGHWTCRVYVSDDTTTPYGDGVGETPREALADANGWLDEAWSQLIRTADVYDRKTRGEAP